MTEDQAEQLIALVASIAESLRILVAAVEAERVEMCNHIQLDSKGRCRGCNALMVQIDGN